jgi:uncharacterized membrane protein YphA (DoxX/SURF4 family)
MSSDSKLNSNHPASLWNKLGGPAQWETLQYKLAVVVVLAQALTVVISWPLWQVRNNKMPNLPSRFYEAVGGPQFDFAWPMMVSLALVLVRPRAGTLLHGGVLLWACLADEMRTQPQMVALWLLLIATTHESGLFWGRWFLVSMWFWAGLHKILSEEWFANAGWWVFDRLGGTSENLFRIFAWSIALAELSLGAIAIFQPRAVAWFCLVMHVGIAGLLSPLGIDWNYSVIPWNLTSGIVGYWILANSENGFPKETRWRIAAAAWLIYPIGFYVGWVDHGIGNILYSAGIPRGLITNSSASIEIHGWEEINVPFPNERRTLSENFRRSSVAGDKLHIRDPRSYLDDLFLEKDADGQLVELSREEFIEPNSQQVAGALVDDLVAVHRLLRAGVQLKSREHQAFVYAAEIPPEVYRPELLEWLQGVPNLEELQLSSTAVTDSDLKLLVGLHGLKGIGLDVTKVTDDCLETLATFRRLETVQHQDTALTTSGVERRTSARSFR